MKYCKYIVFLLAEVLFSAPLVAQNTFVVKGNKTFFNGREFQAIGLRCSNALISDEATDDLISHLPEYRGYGINAVSVYFMGSRYSDVRGYNLDGTLNDTYKKRMARIISSCDRQGMVVLVGILYWGSGMHDQANSFYFAWTQKEANAAIRNTIAWLTSNDYKNVFVDPDNEGMAERGVGFNIDEMICEGKTINPDIPIAYNGKGYALPCADLTIHFGFKTATLPYIETEGTPKQYWGEFSKEEGLNGYINVGIYTPGKMAQQLQDTKRLLDKGHGYFFSSTWLQDIPPRYHLGGQGTPSDPGIRWWFDYIKQHYNKAE